MSAQTVASAAPHGTPPYRRCIGWLGTTALAMGGSNQSLFLIGALFAGQGAIPGQGSAAVPLLIAGLLLGYAALPGWIELVLMSPDRVGGIAAACTEAFAPYGRILSTLTGMCYWWGWVPTCGLTAILSATAINQWCLPQVPVPMLACALVATFTFVNLLGIRRVTQLVVPIAVCSALLAFVSVLAPVWSGAADWHRALDFRLSTPFGGGFGRLTSLMAGLYLVGFAAPAFEAAACHVAETVEPARNVPRAMKLSAAMAGVYFALLPLVWLGTLGPQPLGDDLGQVLGPTFAPVFGAFAKSAAIGFMMFNMFHGTIQPLAGAARTLSQLADDGLAPAALAARNRAGVPYVATLATALAAIVFLLIGDPIWLVAAANFTYLIGIAAPSVAVWLLRRDAPHALRSYRAPRYTVGLGVAAAFVWAASTVLGFEQFGLPTVVFGLAMAYSGAAVYGWRKWEDRRRAGLPGLAPTLHLRLTGAMLLVLALDGAGYILAVAQLPKGDLALKTALEDIFVAVAMLTITVGIVLPGMIAHSAQEVSLAARKLARGTLKEFSEAMLALGRGDLDAAKAHIDMRAIDVRSRDELGEMADSFNAMQREVAAAARGLADAREGLRSARERLTCANASLREKVVEQQRLADHLIAARNAAEVASAAKNRFMARMSHELRTPLNGVLGPADLLLDLNRTGEQHALLMNIRQSGATLRDAIDQLLDVVEVEADALTFAHTAFDPAALVDDLARHWRREADARGLAFVLECAGLHRWIRTDPVRLRQIAGNLLSNAMRFTAQGQVALRARLAVDSAAGATLTLCVSDTGPGIAASKHDAIFAPFAQVDESTTRQQDGTGVGLFLAREMASRLGGQLELDSTPGAGATFRVTLPVACAAPPATAPAEQRLRSATAEGGGDALVHRGGAAPAAADDSRSMPAARILLAEDNPVNRAVAVASLRRMGLAAQIACDGHEAVALFREAPFDLVLMDCHMPGLDGAAATAAIRGIEAQRGTAAVPVVGITADMTSANLAQCRTAGMNVVMAKPFTLADFMSHVRVWLPQGSAMDASGDAPAALPAASGDAAFDASRIDELRLLADDDEPDLVCDIVTTYLDSAATQLDGIRKALANRIWVEVAQIAHTLKSSCLYVGAVGLSSLMRELEAAARANRVADPQAWSRRIEAAFDSASRHLERVVEACRVND
jgi:signal transduction histidine kinase/CheY-like chemotaxis protein/L-asparagine transporter-like permease/HPt (histidine-containing phosphotransfer) domain-containing protein